MCGSFNFDIECFGNWCLVLGLWSLPLGSFIFGWWSLGLGSWPLALLPEAWKLGTAIAARMPIMATTTISSTRVKPSFSLFASLLTRDLTTEGEYILLLKALTVSIMTRSTLTSASIFTIWAFAT